jgi:hypothetical protein
VSYAAKMHALLGERTPCQVRDQRLFKPYVLSPYLWWSLYRMLGDGKHNPAAVAVGQVKKKITHQA